LESSPAIFHGQDGKKPASLIADTTTANAGAVALSAGAAASQMGKAKDNGGLHVKIWTGWWFGTFFIFPYIGNNHPN
jgi:hypothetical protein